jgi:Fibronectin type 3 domain-containing protein
MCQKYFQISVCVIACLLGLTSAAAQPCSSKAYTTGSYIFCGPELPKGFAYLIEKKEASASEWKRAAVIKVPVNEASCRSLLMGIPAPIAAVTKVDDGVIHHFWQRVQLSSTIDSLLAYGLNPVYQYVAGLAWFDDGLRQPGVYNYRISKIAKSGTVTLLNEYMLTFPGNHFDADAQPVRFKLNQASIDISFRLSDTLNTRGIKVFRSPYKQNRYMAISPYILFTRQDNRTVALVTDESVISGMTYSYVAVPFDALGNMGRSSDTLNIYNVAKQADIGIVTSFQAIPLKEKQGISLAWQLKGKLNVTSIEVFRSTNYDGDYQQIATLPPTATGFFDNRNITPATAYFYYIVINNGYGNSLPSARTPAILEGNRPNLIPPQNLSMHRNGRIVSLRFERADRIARAYYIYRADGYVAPLQQLATMKLSTDSVINFTDTLPFTREPSAYSYAVASVNTSNNISPMSARVSTMFSGGQLPVADKVDVMMLDGNLFVTWSNVSEQHSGVVGYKVFRTVRNDDKIVEAEKQVAVTDENTNSYVDKNVTDGLTYQYRVQCQGMDSLEVGSFSQTATKHIPIDLPLSPGQVSAIASANKVALRWTLPIDNKVEKVRIYRAELHKKALLLKELNKEQGFEDTSADRGTYYFYYLVTVDNKGRESRPTDAVSAKL